ncbi:MAG: hypothetical protein ACI8QC_004549 [Planctomycetota bacterium]|jgi:hypothetical protein
MLVFTTGVALAVLSSRMGPPSSVTLTLIGPAGMQAVGHVDGGHRGALPFTIELMLDPLSPEAIFPSARRFRDEVPASDGVLLDGLQQVDGERAPRWWVFGERNELAVFGDFEVLGVAADGRQLFPVELMHPTEDIGSPHRILRLAPAEN